MFIFWIFEKKEKRNKEAKRRKNAGKGVGISKRLKHNNVQSRREAGWGKKKRKKTSTPQRTKKVQAGTVSKPMKKKNSIPHHQASSLEAPIRLRLHLPHLRLMQLQHTALPHPPLPHQLALTLPRPDLLPAGTLPPFLVHETGAAVFNLDIAIVGRCGGLEAGAPGGEGGIAGERRVGRMGGEGLRRRGAVGMGGGVGVDWRHGAGGNGAGGGAVQAGGGVAVLLEERAALGEGDIFVLGEGMQGWLRLV